MNFIDSMSGPGFLIFYFFTSLITLIFFAAVSRKKVVNILVPGLLLNGLGLYRLIDSLAHGHTNVGFLILMMVFLNLFLFIRLLMGLMPAGRSRRLSTDTGDVATAGFFFGAWGGDSSSGSSCSSGSSDSGGGSSCSSGSSCGGGGCGGGGCGS